MSEIDRSKQESPAVGSQFDGRVRPDKVKRAGRPSTTQFAVLGTLAQYSVPVKASELAHILGISRYVIWCALYRLEHARKVERFGLGYRLKRKAAQIGEASWMGPLGA